METQRWVGDMHPTDWPWYKRPLQPGLVRCDLRQDGPSEQGDAAVSVHLRGSEVLLKVCPSHRYLNVLSHHCFSLLSISLTGIFRDLSNNQLTGTIPNSISDMTEMTQL